MNQVKLNKHPKRVKHIKLFLHQKTCTLDLNLSWSIPWSLAVNLHFWLWKTCGLSNLVYWMSKNSGPWAEEWNTRKLISKTLMINDLIRWTEILTMDSAYHSNSLQAFFTYPDVILNKYLSPTLFKDFQEYSRHLPQHMHTHVCIFFFFALIRKRNSFKVLIVSKSSCFKKPCYSS